MKNKRQLREQVSKIMQIGLFQFIIAVVFAGMSLAHDSKGQELLDRRINITCTNQSVESVLEQIEKTAQVRFLYSSELIRADRRVSFSMRNQTLATILDNLLKPLQINYEVSSQQIILKRAVAATTPEQRPNVERAALSVSGKVTSDAGEALPGVSVVIKGTTTGTVTDVNGNFTLTVPDNNAVLVFSFVGFVGQEVPVNNRTTLNVTLATDVKSLSEVVVVGYGTQRRQELTTAVTSVNSQSIERQPVAGFDQALQGQAPGIQVTSPTGAPGAGINVRIRGNNSVSLTNSPLYVIDGVPVLPTYDRELGVGNQRPNPLNTINPSDIESIDVLKDGAAAAIYGLRASNGVVVITTKRGKTGKAQVNFSAYYGIQQLRKKLPMLNSRQFAEYYNDAQTAAGQSPSFANLDSLPYNTDWQDAVYRQAAIRNYQISLSGGTDKTKYYVSGGYFKQDGIAQNSGFDRYSFKLNLDQQMSTRFRLGTSLNLSRTNTNGSVRSELGAGNSGTVLGALAQIPTIPIRNADGTYSINPFQQFDNPVGNLLETRNNAVIYQVIGNAYGEFDVLKNLTFRSSLGLDFRSQIENEFISRNYPGTQNASPATRGSARTGTNQQLIWLWENTLTYDPNIGDKHNLTLLAGQSVQASDRFTSGASVTGFPSNAVPYLSAGTQFTRPSSYQDQWGLFSLFARAIYNYDERYLATLSLRADGSSRFAPNNRFGYFPALSLGWRLSREPFFPQGKAINDLKIRASFGANGNQEIGAYDRFSTYGSGYNYAGTSGISGGIAPDRIGNNALSWETTYQYNAGIDAGFFKDRLTVTLDAYLKQTRNLLTSVPLPFNAGAQNPQTIQNIGTVQNKGFEIGINSTNIQSEGNGFTWSSNLNFSLNRNQVIDIGTLRNEQGQEVDRTIIGDYTITQKGAPLGAFFGYQVQSIFQTTDEIASAATQPGQPKPGDIRFADLNGDGRIDANDRTIIGNPNPDFIAGFTNNFSYKGFELSLFFQGSFGNDIYNQNRVTIEGMSDPLNQTTAVLNRWTPTNTNTTIPRAVRYDPNQNNRFSTRFIEDGTYVRLKNLTVAYNLPNKFLQRAKISGVRLYVTGQNLLTFTNYSGYDPEVSADPFSSVGFGRDFGVYPQARTYTAGLNVTF
ncbi:MULTISPECIES: TonB-dependent receptor [Spirosoma]|uniref:TonB-dependent receptor n=1 Tax=Spirosoma liriopis TaxID=2937440 RepID=A0ABT0HWP6_9BACT|nr:MULTISPECIES: TonB-dependent receptor [Spirosoma]MCK8495950.1 TonB-dependent receptor [Spirosoma liriopis]UHG92913.1 TonB-dependent receptor [Spirosoma oryzicola]